MSLFFMDLNGKEVFFLDRFGCIIIRSIREIHFDLLNDVFGQHLLLLRVTIGRAKKARDAKGEAIDIIFVKLESQIVIESTQLVLKDVVRRGVFDQFLDQGRNSIGAFFYDLLFGGSR